MLKECDKCQASFDVFEEGHVSDYNWSMCGKCWMQELALRGMLVAR
jgi:hypothetical protein